MSPVGHIKILTFISTFMLNALTPKLSGFLSLLVQTFKSAIQQINLYQVDKYQGNKYCIIHWIKIYPMDSIIHLLNNWGQKNFNS